MYSSQHPWVNRFILYTYTHPGPMGQPEHRVHMTHPSTRGSICPHCSILMYSSQYHGSTCTYCSFTHELIPVPPANLYRGYLCTRPSATSQPVHRVHMNSSQYHGSTCTHCSVHMYYSQYHGSTHSYVCKHPSTTGKICTLCKHVLI
jgi:hypothetical protein